VGPRGAIGGVRSAWAQPDHPRAVDRPGRAGDRVCLTYVIRTGRSASTELSDLTRSTA